MPVCGVLTAWRYGHGEEGVVAVGLAAVLFEGRPVFSYRRPDCARTGVRDARRDGARVGGGDVAGKAGRSVVRRGKGVVSGGGGLVVVGAGGAHFGGCLGDSRTNEEVGGGFGESAVGGEVRVGAPGTLRFCKAGTEMERRGTQAARIGYVNSIISKHDDALTHSTCLPQWGEARASADVHGCRRERWIVRCLPRIRVAQVSQSLQSTMVYKAWLLGSN